MGDEQLKKIARELVESVRRNATIDWNEKEQVRAQMRAAIRRLLSRYGYPPDKQPAAMVWRAYDTAIEPDYRTLSMSCATSMFVTWCQKAMALTPRPGSSAAATTVAEVRPSAAGQLRAS
jgi:hypothetical protein